LVKAREKEKLTWPFGKRIGQVRISSNEFAKLIENWVTNDNLSATSKHHEFSSIEDIESNLPLFAGNVEVKICRQVNFDPNEIRINLGPCTVIDSYSKSKETELLIERISSELKHYRIPVLGYLAIVPQFYWALIMFASIWLMPTPEQPFPQYIAGLSMRANAAVVLGLFGVSMAALILAFLPSVYYNPRETFWQRNRDTIIVGILMLLIGAAVGETTGFLSNAGEK
jgi:hypothetical protein